MTVPVIVAAATPSSGSGEPLLLGPSLGTTTAVWDRAVGALAAEHPVLRWDLPGHGASPAASGSFTMAELAAGVLAAADAAGLGRFAAAGVSLGGVASLQLALDAPDRVSSVTLVCSLPRIGSAEAWTQRAADVRGMGTPSLITGSASRWFTPEFREQEPDLVGRLLSGLMDVDDESYARCVEALRDTDLRDRVGELAVPFALYAGEEDSVIPLDDARATVDAARRGTLHVEPGSSHLGSVDHPDAVAALLTATAREGAAA